MPDTVSVVIADDEPLARERLSLLLRDFGGYEVLAECENGAEAMDAVVRLRPAILLLDIRMPGLNGVEVVQALDAMMGRHPAIVFVTAFDEFAIEAFEVEAVDYVLKPVEPNRLRRALERARAREVRRLDADDVLRRIPGTAYPARFALRAVHGVYFVRVADIEWIDAQGNYARLHAGRRAHLLRMTMKRIETYLDPAHFIRVHRSAIVRIDCIERVDPHTHGDYLIRLRDGTRLTSSHAHSAGLKALFDTPAR